MGARSFQALVVRETVDGRFERALEWQPVDGLPAGDVLIRVQYSSLNYKDGLSATGNRGVTKHYPHTPGVDAAGVVAESRTPELPVNREVIVTGYDLGSNAPGGFGQFIRVPAGWVVSKPAGLTLREAMICGTAGFTAAQSIWRLQESGVLPGSGDVLVTGATGGVGCLAVAILAHLGYRVVAATGKGDAADWLRRIGASDVVERAAVLDATAKPLLRVRWAGVVETVGGPFLSAAIRSTMQRGVVTCCGNVGGAEFPLSVYPFILRGVTLAGIDSAQCPQPLRRRIWERLAGDWKPGCLEALAREVSLEQLSAEIDRILRGEQRGRVVVTL